MTIRSAIVAAGATLSLAATPAIAAELPVSSQRSAAAPAASYDIDAETAQRHRYRGYRGHRGYRHRNRVGAGDVIAGVAILGGIAAIASAASRNNRERDRRYPVNAPNYNNRSSGIDRAVNQCVREVERDARVGGVDGVTRSGSGWQVNGSLYNGEGFVCRIGSNGRIEGVDYGFSGAAANSGTYQLSSGTGADQQWDDSVYSRARTTAGYSQPDVPGAQPAYAPAAETSGPQPAYPGGPVTGQQYADEDGYGG